MHFPSIRAVAVAALLVFSPLMAIAKTHAIPDPNPVAVVTISDDWEVEAIPGGIEVTTEDEEYYFAIEVTSKKAAEKDFTSSIAWLIRKGVKIDEASQKEVPFSLNGMNGFMLVWTAADEDGPTQVSVALLQVTETQMLLVTGWGTEQAQRDNGDELNAMMKSLKPLR